MPRHAILDRILRLDPLRDHLEIVFLDSFQEFPWDTTRSLEFALFRTFAIPAIGALLDQTGEFGQYVLDMEDEPGPLKLRKVTLAG